MKFLLTIQADNAAFHGAGCPDEDHDCEGPALQIAMILGGIVDRINEEGLSGFFETIYDSNGNDVGRYALKPDSYT